MGLQSLEHMEYNDLTTLPKDYVPATPGDTDLPITLGFIPRGVLCGADGDLVVRFVGKDTDRTIPVLKGQIVMGPVYQVKSGSTCSPFVIE